jgi:hypothetical protein
MAQLFSWFSRGLLTCRSRVRFRVESLNNINHLRAILPAKPSRLRIRYHAVTMGGEELDRQPEVVLHHVAVLLGGAQVDVAGEELHGRGRSSSPKQLRDEEVPEVVEAEPFDPDLLLSPAERLEQAALLPGLPWWVWATRSRDVPGSTAWRRSTRSGSARGISHSCPLLGSRFRPAMARAS